MFKKLGERWKVSGGRLLLIIITFALGGSLCGYAARKLMLMAGVEKGPVWVILYIVLIIILWPVAVIIVSIPFGQFRFFKNYIGRIWKRTSRKKIAAPLNIAIFASGAGSNAERIIKTVKEGKIAVIITDNPLAGVLTIAAENNIPAEIISLKNKTIAEVSAAYLTLLKKHQIGFIVLAGYLKKIPPSVTNAYAKKIINIHPALLPGYGGAGMYGDRVHEAVIKAGERKSGITIHHADEVYDHGAIIFQAETDISDGETAASLAKKIRALEHAHYPKIISQVLNSQNPR